MKLYYVEYYYNNGIEQCTSYKYVFAENPDHIQKLLEEYYNDPLDIIKVTHYAEQNIQEGVFKFKN